MTIDLTDGQGVFMIQYGEEEEHLTEIDILRMQAAAGMRTATFLKEALGQEAVLELIHDQVQATQQRWKEYVGAADGRFVGHSTRYDVVGISAEEFYDYIAANGGQALQFRMHPEHYVSDFSAGLGGQAVIAEPWGSAMILSHAVFCDPDELRAEGIDIDEMWEPAALYRVCAVGRWADGTFLSAIMHQILPPDTGEADGQPSFVFKTGGFMPAGVPQEVLAGCREHGLVEFTNMVRVARQAIVANRNRQEERESTTMAISSDEQRRERAKTVVDGLLDALRRHDMKAFADFWAPHGTMEFPFAPPGYPRHSSREEVWEYLKDYTDKIDLREVKEKARHYTLDPDTVVLEFEVAGKLVHNGADYNMSYISVITVGDEGIESYRDHWNSLAIALAMGGAEAFMARFAGEGAVDE